MTLTILKHPFSSSLNVERGTYCFKVNIIFLNHLQRLNRNDMKDVGEIVIEMKYIPPGGVKPQGKPGAKTDPLSGQLVVRCVEGKNLDGTEDSNPFCEL